MTFFSFKTENYIGIWDGVKEDFMLIRKSDMHFEPWYLHQEGKEYDNLASLDKAVCDLCDEHIAEVFDTSEYTIVLN